MSSVQVLFFSLSVVIVGFAGISVSILPLPGSLHSEPCLVGRAYAGRVWGTKEHRLNVKD